MTEVYCNTTVRMNDMFFRSIFQNIANMFRTEVSNTHKSDAVESISKVS